MNNTDKIIEDMKKITMLTGEISSIHELNLKNWAFVAFDGVEKIEIKYDLTKERAKDVGEGFVDFNITLDPMAISELLKKRCETLTGWVRHMFWEEIRVEVFFNGVSQFVDSTIEEKIDPPKNLINKEKIKREAEDGLK